MKSKNFIESSSLQIIFCLSLIIAATFTGYFFKALEFPETNIVIVYLLSVVLIARVCTHLAYDIMSSILCTIAFNYFFTVPYHTLAVDDPSYFITFSIMLIVSALTSTLTSKVRRSELEAIEKAKQMETLYALTNELHEASSLEQIVKVSIKSISNVLDIKASMVYIDDLKEPDIKLIVKYEDNNLVCLPFNKDNQIKEDFFEYPIIKNNALFAILQINAKENKLLSESKLKLLASMLETISLSIEGFKASFKEQKYREESIQEHYRGNLLRSISHDLRTPLSSIMGMSEMIRDLSEAKDLRYQFAKDIWNDADYLHSLVENILNLTKIQDGHLSIVTQTEAVEEIIEVALGHIYKRAMNRNIIVDIPEEVVLVKMDAKLIIQVLVNLLDNAIKNTTDESDIEIKVLVENNQVEFYVKDYGQGINNEDLPYIFNTFYTSKNKKADSSRGTGLGLAICETIVKAHNGTIQARNHEDGGAEFKFCIPLI